MSNVLSLDAFRSKRALEQLHGKAFSLCDTNDKYAASRAEHTDMQMRHAKFSPTNAVGFLKSSMLEPLRNQRVRNKSVAQIIEERSGDTRKLPAYLADGLARHGLKLTAQSTDEHLTPGVLVDLKSGGAVERLYVADGFKRVWRDMLIADADSLIVEPADPRLTLNGRFYAFAYYRI